MERRTKSYLEASDLNDGPPTCSKSGNGDILPLTFSMMIIKPIQVTFLGLLASTVVTQEVVEKRQVAQAQAGQTLYDSLLQTFMGIKPKPPPTTIEGSQNTYC